MMSETETYESLEWHSVLDGVLNVDLRSTLRKLEPLGVVAYTDGACIKNPGGPAGWSALLWAAADAVNGQVAADAACVECNGHIPRAKTTTNNRAEISAVLAVLSLAPPTLPLTIYSDSEYTIKVAQGKYQMKANPDLWAIYRKLLSYRKKPPTFIWVQGHAGHAHNERADELAALGALNNDHAAYDRWQNSQAHEAHNRPPSAELLKLRLHAQNLQTLFAALDEDNGRVTEQERKFVHDMAKRLAKNNFAPSDKQSNWLLGLARKYNV
ncbi:MAG TPA: RNase H family protein [Ktedonobacteraceae bacterium]|jgi:ribonuclease HI|nr:RNase H family protein [Ktedonobacteraceae bacterium]